MFPRSIAGLACIIAGINGNPISDEVLKLLNGLIPVANPLIDTVIPDPLKLDVSASKSPPEICIQKIFGACICHASYDYAVHFGTITGLKEFTIEKFSVVDISSDYVGTITVEFGNLDVGLSGGTASAGGKVCGIGGHGDGTASAHVEFGTGVHVQVKGILNTSAPVADQCLKFSITGSQLSISGLKIHDPKVDISIDSLPSFNIGPLAELVQDLDPKIDTLIENAVEKAVVPALEKLVTGLPCIKIPHASQTQNSEVVV